MPANKREGFSKAKTLNPNPQVIGACLNVGCTENFDRILEVPARNPIVTFGEAPKHVQFKGWLSLVPFTCGFHDSLCKCNAKY